jgi:AraC family transcriptional regulator
MKTQSSDIRTYGDMQMNALSPITPEQVPLWIPGVATQDSSGLDWRQITLKGYLYKNQCVQIPCMRDYMIVAYKNGNAQMRRRDGGPWEYGNVGIGKVSILTRSESSEWEWTSDINVTHLYLSHESLSRVAQEVFDKDILNINIEDVVESDDKVLHYITGALEAELMSGVLGGALYVDLVRNQLCIHLLRKYASTTFREYGSYGMLMASQLKRVDDFLNENISNNISLEQMSDIVGMSVYALIRRFQATLGCSPHAYVMNKRLEKAKQILSGTNTPLKIVAAHCGYSDQSHMTRIFRKELNITPGIYRKSTQ